jgi:protein-L-isoaspartate(D-aspartate) O-methyltransferase
MIDFALARRMMVDGQVRTSDVTDLRIIAAMLELPRERFVSAAETDLAYLDTDVPAIGGAGDKPERHLLKPMVLAKLVQAAAVKADDRVLVVGCATGYSAALLSRLARSVVALEQNPVLVRLARDNLEAVGAGNVTVVTGPLTEGWPPDAPYDVVFIDGATETMPRTLCPSSRTGAGSSPWSVVHPWAGRCSTARLRATSAEGRSSMPPPRCCRVLLPLPRSSSRAFVS